MSARSRVSQDLRRVAIPTLRLAREVRVEGGYAGFQRAKGVGGIDEIGGAPERGFPGLAGVWMTAGELGKYPVGRVIVPRVDVPAGLRECAVPVTLTQAWLESGQLSASRAQ
jgi:hypothetical protein